MKLVIDDKIPFIRGLAEQLGTCVYRPGAEIAPADVQDADALIVRTRTHANEALLKGSKVQLVVTATIGHDHLDKEYLAQAGIEWRNCPGCNAESVAQYVRNSLWRAMLAGHLSPNPQDTCVGIVGVGHVGSAVSRALRAEGFRTLHCDPPKGEPCTLDDLALEADIICLHTPLTTTGPCPTFHLADEAFFRSLRKRPLFLNAARGECMDTAAVKTALREGLIRQAIIDTWEKEPDIDRELLEAAFIATPHIAGYSADGKARGTQMALEAVARHFHLPLTFDILPPALPPHFTYGELPYPTSAFSPRALEQLRLYNPHTDAQRLKAAPSAFEQQRGHYPFRREYAEVSALP